MSGDQAIVVRGLSKKFKARKGSPDVVAANDVSFEVGLGRTLGIVGESGSGKSTVARCILGLTSIDAGSVEILGRPVHLLSKSRLRALRADLQIVFQESKESLDPRYRVARAIAEPLILHSDMSAEDRRRRVVELMGLVALDEGLIDRYPHQLSGGEQQRVNLARALATEPKVLVLDEPTASLDVSVQAGVLRLLLNLQRHLDLTYVLISHDLATIRAVCERVVVMYLGQVLEVGPVEVVLADPEHPYTRLLLGSELSIDPDSSLPASISFGDGGSADRLIGCVFAPRCPLKVEGCDSGQPPLRPVVGDDHYAACIFSGELDVRFGSDL